MIECYTDGATSNNGKKNAPGGWAFIIVKDDEIIFKKNGHVENATNNICELMAMIIGCNIANQLNNKLREPIVVYSDSAYIINCYNDGWYKKWEKNGWINSKKEPVANKDLWEKLLPYFKNEKFDFKKVKGHSGNKDRVSYWNNIVDQLAVEAKFLKQ